MTQKRELKDKLKTQRKYLQITYLKKALYENTLKTLKTK